MADKIHVDLVAANSQLQHVNANDWVLILDKAKNPTSKVSATPTTAGSFASNAIGSSN